MTSIIYRIFYKKSAEKTMMAMENCQAYIDYKNSRNKYCEINDTALKDTIVHIDLTRERAISNVFHFIICNVNYDSLFHNYPFIN